MNSRKALTLPACSSFLHVILSGLLRTSLNSSETLFETLSKGRRALFQTVRPQSFVSVFQPSQPVSALVIKKRSGGYRPRSGRRIRPT